MSVVNKKYLDITVFNNSLRYIGIPRTATQSVSLYLKIIDEKFKKNHSEKITIVIIRNPLDRLLSALRHNTSPDVLSFESIVNKSHFDEHYLPFTEFDFFHTLEKNTMFLNYDNNIIKQIKNIIECNYNININDIKIPYINVTETKRSFGCPYRLFVNQYSKQLKKIYKNDIDFYNKIFKEI